MRPTNPTSTHRLAALPAAWRTTGLLSLLALGVASPLAVLALLGSSAAVGQTGRLGLAPGTHDEGVAVALAATADPAGSAAAAHGLALRRGCQWGQPGRKPYQGSTRQALQAAGLPEDVIAQIEAQQRSGEKRGRLEISRRGIRHTGDGRVFPAHGIALTYGMTLCLDATVNFAKGHVEMADLYEARDAQGKSHAVMVPDVCGNVSVLGAAGSRGARGAVAGVSATLARRAQALAELAEALDSQAPRPAAVAGGQAPEAAAGGQAAGAAADGQAAEAAADGQAAAPADSTRPAAAAVQGSPAAGPAPLGGAAAPGQAGAVAAPLVMLAAVTDLLVPPAAVASVAWGASRVAAAAGRGLETLAASTVVGGGGGSGGGSGGGGVASGSAQAVPEPGSLSISLLGLGLLAWRMRRLSRRARPSPSSHPCASSSSSGHRPSSSSSSPASARTG